MLIDVGDWVQTDTKKVGKVASVDADKHTATITRVCPQQLRLVAETYSLDELNKFEIDR